MRGWSVRAVQSSARRRPALRCAPRLLSCPLLTRCFSTRTCHHEKDSVRHRISRRYAIFDKVERPSNIDAWIGLLEGGLPPHLRDWAKSTDPPVLSSVHVAEILLAAQYPVSEDPPLDLLCHLAVHLGRWAAVIWLIKGLLETFPGRHSREPELSAVNNIWDNVSSLSTFTAIPSSVVLDSVGPVAPQIVERRTLDELTSNRPRGERALLALGHDAVGQVWRTLGEMTKSCAGGEIKPEILEIIAYLHHKEVMPISIYQSKPHPDASAIQKPPLLSILSSRILTSLSDAAWRAHEKLVVEEAKAKGAEYAALRPEIPGSVYRVNVTGLRPELWMELILWSCIQGGWTLAGTGILRSIATDGQWKPLSWKEYEKTIPSTGHTKAPEWLHWERAYNTRDASRMDAPHSPTMNIQRTVSAEVVNAYIDAVSNHVDLGVGGQGLIFEDVVRTLHVLKVFLRQTGSFLDLSFGSWDALVTRLVESQTIMPEQDAGEIQQLHALTAGFGSSIAATNIQDEPAYVRDGNLAMQGLLHRALHGQIMAGSLEGALKIFRRIQLRADHDKQKSLKIFNLGRIRRKLLQNDMFTSNFVGIDYPAFSIKLPTTILGSLLDLITDAKEYSLGQWLLYNDEIDSPIIGEALYKDPYIQPAVIRFAAASNDRALLAKFTEQRLLKTSFRAVLDTQVESQQWDAALRILEYLTDTRGEKWSIQNLSNVARVMLLKLPNAMAGDADSMKDLDRARTTFRDMVSGKYSRNYETHQHQHQILVQNVLSVLSAINGPLARFCAGLRFTGSHHRFLLKAHNFNILLDGVVHAFGSAHGKRLLDIFWPHAARSSHDAVSQLTRHLSGRRRMPRARPSILKSMARQRIVVQVPGDNGDDVHDLTMYGVLTPNVSTVLIILRAALAELKEDSRPKRSAEVDDSTPATDMHRNGDSDEEHTHGNSARDMVRWATLRLAELPYVEESIVEELDKTLLKYGMDDVRNELPAILQQVEEDLETEVREHVISSADDDEQASDFEASIPEGNYAS